MVLNAYSELYLPHFFLQTSYPPLLDAAAATVLPVVVFLLLFIFRYIPHTCIYSYSHETTVIVMKYVSVIDLSAGSYFDHESC